MSSRQRYVLEGTWTGYVARQCRVVHREVVLGDKRADRLRKVHKIIYTDGTALILHLREAEHRERVREIHSYDELIHDAEKAGLNVYHVVPRSVAQ